MCDGPSRACFVHSDVAMSALPDVDSQLRLPEGLVTVQRAQSTADGGVDLVVFDADGIPKRVLLTSDELSAAVVPTNDRGGEPVRALSALWGRWMQHAVPRIRSAVLATRPLRPYAHQDEAVHSHMLNQPRLRFLLGDEPGTGKTIMAAMYLAEGRRRALVPGRALFIVPAHLVTKWERDLKRFVGVTARVIDARLAADPADLDPRYDTWIVSLDLYSVNMDVRRKVAGRQASWSLVVFDEAHRLTPTSQLLNAAREVAGRTHHLLLMTATPHRGKEYYFRGLMNLLDPTSFPWDPRQRDYPAPLTPSSLSFLRRMKEDLVDHDGEPLFPPRFSETLSVELEPAEAAAYQAVMNYVDVWYADLPIARSVYGKRAASGVHAALATLRRRETALKGPAAALGTTAVPTMVTEELAAAASEDASWTEAETAVVSARTSDKSGEHVAVAAVITTLEMAVSTEHSSKWHRLGEVLEKHSIVPGSGQLLVFSEFADTARWLAAKFADAGFSTEILEGSVATKDRDALQERFLAGKFEVLVSTDAGGEGIDLQSANVMVDWDLPWSMVRLEQRMGRLHRVGQTRPVYVYHLVAPATREGRVQEVMLANIAAASLSLSGRLYDLLDATAERAGFDWSKAMLAAQSGKAVRIPTVDELVTAARELVAEERSLTTPANLDDALERFAADRLEAINPVIVDAMVERVAASAGWAVGAGPAKGIRTLSCATRLPPSLGGSSSCLIAADGASVRQAINDGATELDDVIVLGPTEDAFQDLVDFALAVGEGDLVRGAVLADAASLTSYTLALYDADIQVHDGVARSIRKAPLLIRASGGQTIAVAWESLMNLRPAKAGDPAPPTGSTLSPAIRHDAATAARAALAEQVAALEDERTAWIVKARIQLDDVGYRLEDQLADADPVTRAERMALHTHDKADRLETLRAIAHVQASDVRLVGWLHVVGAARADQLGYDPNSEKLAIATVVAELEERGFDVDDRQTAGVGYDLYARHQVTREQRLVEVKGLEGGLRPVWLEQHEWIQAQQRKGEYWLYVVDSCSTAPTVRVRLADPAGALAGPRRVERFQIPLSELTRFAKDIQ